MLIVADIAALDPTWPVGSAAAHLLRHTDRSPVELTPAAAQRLACDATMRTVFVDGAEVLGATAARRKVSATLRAALVVRDGGCRFPACQRPAEACDAHHIVPATVGGPTELANLALVCRDHHHAIHDAGWNVTLDADGMMTCTRRGITVTSQPRAAQHVRPSTPPPAGRPRRRRPPHRVTRSGPGIGADGSPAECRSPGEHVSGSDQTEGFVLPF